MRVALGQIDMVWEDKKASVAKAEKMICDAALQNADIIIFPEMSFTGFSMNLLKTGEKRHASDTVKKMCELSEKYDIAIGFGWAALPEKEGEKGKNVFSVVDNTGKLIAEYEKIHPFTYGGESDVYDGGDKIVSFPFKEHAVSLFVCYDLRFPEIFQAAAKKSDVMFVIANWPQSRNIHWQTLLRARAIETQSYVAGVNCVGEHDGILYSGDSMAVDSIGNILGQISGKEGVLICELDDRAWGLREKFQTRKDRKEELYYDIFLMYGGKDETV